MNLRSSPYFHIVRESADEVTICRCLNVGRCDLDHVRVDWMMDPPRPEPPPVAPSGRPDTGGAEGGVRLV